MLLIAVIWPVNDVDIQIWDCFANQHVGRLHILFKCFFFSLGMVTQQCNMFWATLRSSVSLICFFQLKIINYVTSQKLQLWALNNKSSSSKSRYEVVQADIVPHPRNLISREKRLFNYWLWCIRASIEIKAAMYVVGCFKLLKASVGNVFQKHLCFILLKLSLRPNSNEYIKCSDNKKKKCVIWQWQGCEKFQPIPTKTCTAQQNKDKKNK